MKFFQVGAIAMFASSMFVSATPTPVANENKLVAREDINEVFDILHQLNDEKQKRELNEDGEQNGLSKREDSLLSELINALANSGIASDVWSKLNNDTDLKTEIKSTVEATVKGAIVHGPALIKAVINSGLIGDLFHDISNDSDLQDVFAKVAKELFNDAVELVEGKFNISSSSNSSSSLSVSSTGSDSSANSITMISLGSGSSPTASSNTDLSLPSDGSGSGVTYSSIDLSGLDKRENYEVLEKDDLANTIVSIVQEIANSGLVKNLVQKVASNPQQFINFLSSALREGTVILSDLYKWAKQSGILQEGLDWLAKNTSGIVGTLAGFVAKLFGGSSAASSGSAASTVATQAAATTTAQTLATTATATTLTTVGL
ncbi:Piso0_005638 [Millerozyma farinosa CBS 7064]|uniref:Piso0_005638 protein n=1 Tax=Pichia sorbitophila (strain ATCC MYA-4447 / BCRC 22081 / CBS 7064 / NBRC 10061 / NRRL Y-12695) TaxID=559304 RepID=G8Y2I3_PICSO|nr:Piso0_005638 [Millerozyma farinosa CBS 7064]